MQRGVERDAWHDGAEPLEVPEEVAAGSTKHEVEEKV
jgi:hypothetical protein